MLDVSSDLWDGRPEASRRDLSVLITKIDGMNDSQKRTERMVSAILSTLTKTLQPGYIDSERNGRPPSVVASHQLKPDFGLGSSQLRAFVGSKGKPHSFDSESLIFKRRESEPWTGEDQAFRCPEDAFPTSQLVTEVPQKIEEATEEEEEESEIPQCLSHTLSAIGGLEATFLPADWPHSVTLRQSMIAESTMDSRKTASRVGLLGRRLHKSSSCDLTPLSVTSGPSVLRQLVISPTSMTHMVYSLLNLVVLLYDLTVIPFALAWNVPYTGALHVVATASCIFWTFDIGVSFLTGYQRGEQIEMQLSKIAVHFMRTSLVPDLAMVVCNWLSLALETMSDGANGSSIRIIRFAQVGKLLRITALARLVRVTKIVEQLMENSLSDAHRHLSKCIVVVLGTLWVNHLIGCAWFAIGRLGPTDTGLRWVEATHSEADNDFMYHGGLYQYVTAVHWSVAQVTLGAIEVNPVNTAERIFCIACLTSGLVLGSTLISSLSASMVDYQMSRKVRVVELRKLRRFLRDNQITPALTYGALQQARERLSMHECIQEKECLILQKLSSSLRSEIRLEMFLPYLNQHPLFRLWAAFDRSLAKVLCMEAMENITLVHGDELFLAGLVTDKAYYLQSGTLDYIKEPGTWPGNTWAVRVEESCWLAEASLWVHWMHVGTARAVKNCQVVQVSSIGIESAIRNTTDLREVTAEYCRQFHSCIVQARPPRSEWPDDLKVPRAKFDEIMMQMPSDMQMAISLYAVEHAVDTVGPLTLFTRTKPKVESLKEEIRNGVSCVMLGQGGHPERIVCVVALRAMTKENKVLVELGKLNKETPSKVKVSCELPACKQDMREPNEDTLKRLLEQLGLHRKRGEVTEDEVEVETRASKDFHVMTKYIRKVHSIAISEEDLQLPTLAPPLRALRSTGSRSLSSQKRPEFETLEGILVNSGQKTVVYAWLSTSAFKFLGTGECNKELENWLMSLQAVKSDLSVSL